MSVSVELQDAILALLLADAGVSALIGSAIYDGDAEQYPCIIIGPSSFVPDDAECIAGRVEAVQLDCWVENDKRLWVTKRLVDAVTAALHNAETSLATHALVSLRVTLAQSFMDRDGLTGHGVVQVEAEIEER